MVRKNRGRSVYDPSIMDRVDAAAVENTSAFSISCGEPDPLHDDDEPVRRSSYYVDDIDYFDDDDEGLAQEESPLQLNIAHDEETDRMIVVSDGTTVNGTTNHRLEYCYPDEGNTNDNSSLIPNSSNAITTNAKPSKNNNLHDPYYDYETKFAMKMTDGDTDFLIEGHREILDPRLHKIAADKRHDKCRRRFLTWLVVGGAVAIIATCSVIISNTRKVSSNPTVVLSPPDDSLVINCQVLVNGTKNDPYYADKVIQCNEGCEKADCCNFPADLELSCATRKNRAACEQYDNICHVLDSYNGTETVVNVKPAPDNIRKACSINSLLTEVGIRDCTKICSPYKCCYETDGNSTCTDQANCKGYHACQNLDALANIKTDISDAVEEKCERDLIAKSFNHRIACYKTCEDGECCFDDDKDGLLTPDKCSDKPDGFCAQYLLCQPLHDNSLPDFIDTTTATATDASTKPKLPDMTKETDEDEDEDMYTLTAAEPEPEVVTEPEPEIIIVEEPEPEEGNDLEDFVGVGTP